MAPVRARLGLSRNFSFLRGSATKLKFKMLQEIRPFALYSVSACASLLNVHPVTIYQSLCGLKSFPLPPVVRLGRSIRFRGSDILFFIGGLSAVKDVVTESPAKVRRGRPTKAQVVAKRLAGGTE
jgi:hypothetical protein